MSFWLLGHSVAIVYNMFSTGISLFLVYFLCSSIAIILIFVRFIANLKEN